MLPIRWATDWPVGTQLVNLGKPAIRACKSDPSYFETTPYISFLSAAKRFDRAVRLLRYCDLGWRGAIG
jgi:hypothetical protein